MIDPLGGPAYWLPFVIAFAVAYLIGSIPFGFLLTRFTGAGDLRQLGSGNIGATNVLRTGRKGLAAATLALDAAKGGLPAWLAYHYFGPDIAVVAGFAAVLGHCFPIWLGFRGGKGVATAAGVLLALTPLVCLLALVVFAVVVWRTRFVSLGSILAAVAASPLAWAFGHVQSAEMYILLALLILGKHHGNIRRLLAGRESRVGDRPKQESQGENST